MNVPTYNRTAVIALVEDGWTVHRADAKGKALLPGGTTPYVVLRKGCTQQLLRCTWEAMRWAQAQLAAVKAA